MDKKNTYYIIAAIVVVVLIVFLVSRQPAETPEDETPEAPVEEPVAEEPEENMTETPEPTEEVEVSEDTGKIDYGSRGILSDVKCEDGKMSAIITNVLDKEMYIKPKTYENELRVMVNGIVSKWYECDKETLAPGEHTYCSDLLGPQMSARLTNDDRNEVAVWFLSSPDNRGLVSNIECSGTASTDETEGI